jgi:hypothetical protein
LWIIPNGRIWWFGLTVPVGLAALWPVLGGVSSITGRVYAYRWRGRSKEYEFHEGDLVKGSGVPFDKSGGWGFVAVRVQRWNKSDPFSQLEWILLKGAVYLSKKTRDEWIAIIIEECAADGVTVGVYKGD